MDTNQYCINLSNELQRWRDAIHKENEIISKLSSADKQNMLGFVEDLRMLEAEMDERIDQLKTQCPTAWAPENAENVMEPGGELTCFALTPEESDKAIGGGNFGG
jgi:Tfp pilus assembly protein PilO